MSDIFLLIVLGVMILSIASDAFRIYQFKKYIKVQKDILIEMENKNKELKEIGIRLQMLSDITESNNV